VKTAATLVVAFCLVAWARSAAADEPSPVALRDRRETLLAFGVSAADTALRLGERALERCVREPRSAFCSLAAASFDLAAARVEEGEAESLARSLGVTPVRCAGEAGLAEARAIVPMIARRLAEAERRLRAAPENPRSERAALVMLGRILRELALTRTSTARTLERIAAQSTPAAEDAALERARAVADEAIEEATRADDEFVGRHRSGTARSRTRDRAAAIAGLEGGLRRRIAALPEGTRTTYSARLEAAVAITDPDGKLEALLDIVGDLDAASRQ